MAQLLNGSIAQWVRFDNYARSELKINLFAVACSYGEQGGWMPSGEKWQQNASV